MGCAQPWADGRIICAQWADISFRYSSAPASRGESAVSRTGGGRLAGDRFDKSSAELGTEQAVDDEVDARVDVDEQLGGRLQVEDEVPAAVPGDDVAHAVEDGQR